MKKTGVLMALFFILYCARAQETKIKFVQGLTWDQINEKAKKEHKCIFVDCYATWCGPCKDMDKNVFTDNKVGETFNDKFICVKVQMDKTPNDDKQTKENWY